MKKYHISGKEKVEKEATQHCETCKDGQIFASEDFTRCQKYAPKVDEFICSVCNTKYKKALKDADKLISAECDNCKFYKEEKCGNEDPMYLCIGNYDRFLEKLFVEDKMDINKEELFAARETYAQTGVCNNHIWIESKPFKTAEGRFTVKNCMVCKLAQTQVGAQIYQDKLSSLVSWLSQRGIMEEQIEREKVTDLGFDSIKEIKEIGASKMLEVPKEKDFGFLGYDNDHLPELNLFL